MQILLKLSSFNYTSLLKICNKLLKKQNFFSFELIGPIYLPKKESLFTVLRSPHVNKKSRNQFKLIIYKRLLIIKLNKNININKAEIKLFLNYLKHIGGSIQIQIEYNIFPKGM